MFILCSSRSVCGCALGDTVILYRTSLLLFGSCLAARTTFLSECSNFTKNEFGQRKIPRCRSIRSLVRKRSTGTTTRASGPSAVMMEKISGSLNDSPPERHRLPTSFFATDLLWSHSRTAAECFNAWQSNAQMAALPFKLASADAKKAVTYGDLVQSSRRLGA